MNKVEVQGHRGCRGVLPENTIVGFAHTLATGVDAIEFDIGLSADNQLVIVHDRLLSRDIFRNNTGEWIAEPEPTVRSQTLQQIRQFDVGRLRPDSHYSVRFPHQVAVDGVRVPTLREYIELLDQMNCRDVGLNIEVKISPLASADTASPDQFVDSLLDILDRYDLIEQSVIQSFDWRIPMLVSHRRKDLRTSCLTVEGNDEDTVCRDAGKSPWAGGLSIRDTNGSVPRLVVEANAEIWAPWHGDLNAENVTEAHSLGLRVITWTVNKTADIERLLTLGVDGMISDYPAHMRKVFTDNGYAVPEVPATDSPVKIPHIVSNSPN